MMKSVVVGVFLFVSIAYVSGQAFVATTVLFGGIGSPTVLPTQSVGQVVTSVSDVVSFSFWFALISGPGGSSATASVAAWSGSSAGTPLSTQPITLPTSGGYTQVTATFNIINLDPTKNYIIYITFPASTPSSPSHYDVFTTFTAGGNGGFAKATGSTWSVGYPQNVLFSFVFNSVLSVSPTSNYAVGHGEAGWGCAVQTAFSSIQVNWQTLVVNTGYFGGLQSNTVLLGSSSCSTSYAPYGTAASCWDAWPGIGSSTSSIDLTGTPYAVDDTFEINGYFPGGNWALSSANQVLVLAVSGDCGFGATVSAVTLGEGPATFTGGFYLQLAKI